MRRRFGYAGVCLWLCTTFETINRRALVVCEVLRGGSVKNSLVKSKYDLDLTCKLVPDYV